MKKLTKEKKKKNLFESGTFFLNATQTVGIISVKEGVKPLCVINLDVGLIKEAIKILETTTYDYVDLTVYGSDKPVIMGIKGIGVAIAPRIPNVNDDRYKIK